MKLLTDYLPNKINKVLFGDRLQYGFKVNEDDADWFSGFQFILIFIQILKKRNRKICK